MKNRRSFLKQAAVGGVLSSLLPMASFAGNSKRSTGGAKRSLRIAHITDVHMLDKPTAVTNFSTVLKSINQLKDKPEFIVNTGDTVMDENRQTRETVYSHWKEFGGNGLE